MKARSGDSGRRRPSILREGELKPGSGSPLLPGEPSLARCFMPRSPAGGIEREGSERMIEALNQARGSLAKVFRSQGVDKYIAEDILHDVVILALQKLDQINNLASWLVATTRRQCLVYFRKSRSHAWVPMEDYFTPSCDAVQERGELLREIKELWPSRHRVLLELLLEGYSCTEIAERTGYNVTSIRSLKSRGARRVRVQVSGSESGVGSGQRQGSTSEVLKTKRLGK